jgi:hypothetical protein
MGFLPDELLALQRAGVACDAAAFSVFTRLIRGGWLDILLEEDICRVSQDAASAASTEDAQVSISVRTLGQAVGG